ncbi:MAG: carboxypeptidase regulatory-like domain-containing protein [Candidatus Bathyarchaeia archaeon]|jgi:uncharacterized membrane protein
MIAFLFLIVLIVQLTATTKADSYNFHGIIVDEDGSPLSNVAIQVYDMLKVSSQNSQNGYYVTTALTQSDGSYRIDLYSGTFKLVFDKDGYVTQTKILGFTTVQDVDLGSTKLIRSVSVTLTTIERTASPGSILIVPITIANVGDRDESVQLMTFNKANWTSTILDNIGEVDAVTLKAGMSTQLNLRVIIPVDASGSTIVNVTAVGAASVKSSLKITVVGGFSHFVTCQYPSSVTSPGAEVSYKVVVTNPYPYPVEAMFTLSGVSNDWNPLILNDAKTEIQSTNIASGGSSEITIIVDVPQTITANTTATLELRTSLGGLLDTTPLSLVVQHRLLTLGIKTSYPIQTIELGKTASFPITLTNPGETDETLSLSMDNLPAKWSGSFTTEDGGAIQSILIDARSSVNLYAVFKPNIDAEPLVYNIIVKAISTNLNGTLPLRVDLVGNTDMKLVVANLYGQMNVGDTKQIQVTLENTGYSIISYPVLLTSASVDSIVVSYSPIDVITIAPGQSQVFTLTITANEGTAQGDYIIEVRGSSPQILTDPVDIRMTVAASGSQTLIIAGVLILAFASILLVYRKFRRR